MTPRIALVAPGNVASNPRLVKEADALHAAGYDVRVIATDLVPFVRPLDEALLAGRPWRCTRVGSGGRAARTWRAARHRLTQRWAYAGGALALRATAWAHSPRTALLAPAARAWPADLYIAHYIAALPAAALAAESHGAALGFDAEDYHLGELDAYPGVHPEIALRDRLERHFLPWCVHRTAAAPLIAQAYEDRYGLAFETILNVFPLAHVPAGEERDPQRVGDEPSLYWFSQTIGPARGLEAMVHALGRMRTPARLHLRGHLSWGYGEHLMQLAMREGVADRVHFLESAPPDAMVRLAAGHDLGLCLEQTHPYNRAICLTNKVFAFLLAGLPLVLSRTPAQEALAYEIGGAGRVVDLADAEATAAALDAWLGERDVFGRAREAARRLARERYNWDLEQQKLLVLVERAVGPPKRAAAAT